MYDYTDVISATTGEVLVEAKQVKKIAEQCIEFLPNYSYSEEFFAEYPTDCVPEIIQNALNAKSELIEILRNHPNWNQDELSIILTDETFTRPILRDVSYSCINYFYNNIPKPKMVKTSYTRVELEGFINRLWQDMEYINRLVKRGYSISNNDIARTKEDYTRFNNLFNQYERDYCVFDNSYVEHDDYKLYQNTRDLFYNFKNNDFCSNEFISKYYADYILQKLPTLQHKGIIPGLKTTKAIGKVAKACGFDKDENYNKVYTRLCDALSPMQLKNYNTIISVHPITYLTMSFGDTWCSCHNIDKTMIRQSSQDGQYGGGCCSSGTMSYMLDKYSMVFSTTEKKKGIKDLWDIDKHTRQMFAFGNNKLLQSRLYPQGSDGAREAYTETRNIVQRAMAECLGVDNDWLLKRDGSFRRKHFKKDDGATCYSDWTYSDGIGEECTVSLLKSDDKILSDDTPIYIGKRPICLKCGRTHFKESSIVCDNCSRDERNYCEYHDEYENISQDEMYYIENYGYICEDAYEDNDEFFQDAHDGYYYRDYYDERIYATNGNMYISSSNANNDDVYHCSDTDNWAYIGDVRYCEECGRYFENYDSWNDELDCCNECAENRDTAED